MQGAAVSFFGRRLLPARADDEYPQRRRARRQQHRRAGIYDHACGRAELPRGPALVCGGVPCLGGDLAFARAGDFRRRRRRVCARSCGRRRDAGDHFIGDRTGGVSARRRDRAGTGRRVQRVEGGRARRISAAEIGQAFYFGAADRALGAPVPKLSRPLHRRRLG